MIYIAQTPAPVWKPDYRPRTTQGRRDGNAKRPPFVTAVGTAAEKSTAAPPPPGPPPLNWPRSGHAYFAMR
jgi:hypothetical protein